MGDVDELHVLGHFLDHAGIATDIDIVERRINVRLDLYFVDFSTNSGRNVGISWPAYIGGNAPATQGQATINLVAPMGMGGVGVEIYKDVSLRMAPLTEADAGCMIQGLTAGRLLSGYRGAAPVNLELLTKTLIDFSHLVMSMQDLVESIDLNPVMCTQKECIIADSRIMLKKR